MGNGDADEDAGADACARTPEYSENMSKSLISLEISATPTSRSIFPEVSLLLTSASAAAAFAETEQVF